MVLICGLDSGKQSVYACCLDSDNLPSSMRDYAQSYDLREYDYKQVKDILAIGADIYAIEPTGVYSRLFVDALTAAGRKVLYVPSYRIRYFSRSLGLQKSDRHDPVAIAYYVVQNLGDPRAYITPALPELREVVGEIHGLKRLKATCSNWIGQRLCFEWPEIVRVYEQSARDWLDVDPPALWRYLAGEKVYNQKRRDSGLAETVGCGLSDKTRELAGWLVRYERTIAPLEQRIEVLLKDGQFGHYHQVFDQMRFSSWTRANFLPSIYPIDKFMGDDGSVRREWVDQDGRRSKRNRSLNAFKMYCGLGQVENSSGQVSDGKPSGSPRLRSVWYQHLKVRVVMARKASVLAEMISDVREPWLCVELVDRVRQQFGLTYPIAEAWVQYQWLRPQQIKERQRLSKVAARQGKHFFRLLCG